MTTPRERPIIFAAPMVRALLSGAKTQTRRLVKPQPPVGFSAAGYILFSSCREDNGAFVWRTDNGPLATVGHRARCPFGSPGDRLWVRETWADSRPADGDGYVYRATDPAWGEEIEGWQWRPSTHMPRAASRLTLEVTGVRVQRVQEIAQADAMAEGARKVVPEGCERWADGSPMGNHWSAMHPHPCEVDAARGAQHCLGSPQTAFGNLWNSINGRREGCSWDENPWVWVVSFRRVCSEVRHHAE